MNITFKNHNDHGGSMAFTANWSDEKGRYHVWIGDDGTIDEVIYMNPNVNADGSFKKRHDVGYFATRNLDLNARRWSLALQTISVAIRAGALDRARAERRAVVDAARAVETASMVVYRREKLQRIAKATGVPELVAWLEMAEDDTIADLPGDCF